MHVFKRFSTLVLATISLSACSSEITTNISPRVQYWEKELNKIIIPGKDIEEIRSWLEFRKLKYSVSKEEYKIYVNLEQISAEEWFCNFWQVSSEIDFDTSNKIKDFKVTTVGQCL